ncbi:hypothetical protein [Spirosoma endophyticum]|uniref:Uncharacterized protein n=1 Tax=Spirosoma endophyticum TaxID=662367 RepID=A0A1I2H4U1_9BACT|nr:hypothetical protein [Spirosoma endophyticum]SFF24712.1 hypothetical protein SAMN05216167_1389 [Spirosoma endophyticum]
MSTGQKYSGKGDSTTPPTPNGSPIEQTGENGPPTAKPTLSANAFTFDELVLFNGLPDVGKTIIATLVNSGSYQPDQLTRALVYLAQHPQIESLQDESLQAVLVEPAQQIPFTIEGARGQAVDPITIELPAFLVWQIRDAERTKSLLSAIEKVFDAFSSSEDGKNIDEDINQMVAYTALRMDLMKVIETAARQVGTYEKPKVSDYLFDTPRLALSDPQADSEPVLVNDPRACTDIDQLQEWVHILQNMGRLQAKVSANYEKIDANNTKMLDAQSKRIIALEHQATIYQGLLDSQQNKTIRYEHEQKLPQALPYIDLTLYLGDAGESDVELVRFILDEAAREKLKEVYRKITIDETEEAFFANEEYSRLQNILARLTQAITETANDSFIRSTYQDRPAVYVSTVESALKRLLTRKAAFIEEYSVFTSPETEESEPNTIPPELSPDA